MDLSHPGLARGQQCLESRQGTPQAVTTSGLRFGCWAELCPEEVGEAGWSLPTFAEFRRPGRKGSVEPPGGLCAGGTQGSCPTSAVAEAMTQSTLGTLVLVVNCPSGMK